MHALLLLRNGLPIRELSLDAHPLEFGSDARCDVVVHDADCAPRHLLVQAHGGRVFVHDLRDGAPPRALLPGECVALGSEHAVEHVDERPTATHGDGRTEPLQLVRDPGLRLSLVVGRSAEARRVAIDARPVCVGTSQDNDLALVDRAVGAHHFRLEPTDHGVFVRDLGSRNGTWVDGVRVLRARVGVGARLRAGRTDLVLVQRGSARAGVEPELVAASPAMQHVVSEVERFAKLPWPALLLGESGAGKEGLARALHARGPRREKPFVAINAGGLPRDVIESELFGHEKGAFTGAQQLRRGVFEQADGGTLFLDEIGELPLELQARLLRVLETWEVRRVGAESVVRVDVRLVCATHRDLRQMVMDRMFREDLFYRLTRLVVEVPPLRRRPEDVIALAKHFLHELAADVGRRALSDAATARLLAHRWPGNARELRNVLGCAAAMAPCEVLDAADIERAIHAVSGPARDRSDEHETVRDAVERHRGNLTAAARALGIPRSTLRGRLRDGRG